MTPFPLLRCTHPHSPVWVCPTVWSLPWMSHHLPHNGHWSSMIYTHKNNIIISNCNTNIYYYYYYYHNQCCKLKLPLYYSSNLRSDISESFILSNMLTLTIESVDTVNLPSYLPPSTLTGLAMAHRFHAKERGLSWLLQRETEHR